MTHLEFVQAWFELRDTRKIAERFGMDTHQVSNAATHMRKYGVDLPALERRANDQKLFEDKLDVDAINKWIWER